MPPATGGGSNVRRRPTLPMTRGDTKDLLEYFLFQQELKTLGVKQRDKERSSHVDHEQTSASNVDDKSTNQLDTVIPLQRRNSYRLAIHRDSIGYDLDDLGLEQEDSLKSFRKIDYDTRKYVSLPMDTKAKRKSVDSQTSVHSNNNTKKVKSKYLEREFSVTGNLPSPDSPYDDDDISINDRPKKTAFQKAKQFLFLNFLKAKTEEEKWRKKHEKQKELKQKAKAKKKVKKSPTKKAPKTTIEDVFIYDKNRQPVCNVDKSATFSGFANIVYTDDQRSKRHASDSSCQTQGLEISPNDAEQRAKGQKIGRFKSFKQSLGLTKTEALKSPKDATESGKDFEENSSRRNRLQSPNSDTYKGTNCDTHVQQGVRPGQKEVTDVFKAIINDRDDSVTDGLHKHRRRRRGDRSNLQLTGLTPCHDLDSAAPGSPGVHAHIEVDVDVRQRRVKSPDGNAQNVITTRKMTRCTFYSDVEEDGNSSPKKERRCEEDDRRAGDVHPFDMVDGEHDHPIGAEGPLTEEQKKRRIEYVASRLAKIGDGYISKIESESSDSDSKQKQGLVRLTSLENAIITELRREGVNIISVIKERVP